MNSIKLKIPVRDNSPSVKVDPSVKHIRHTLESLPLANPSECGVKISQLVYQLNRAPIDVNVRIRIMALVLPLVDDIINSLRNSYINAGLPLSEKRQRLAQSMRRLLVETSHGYKIIIMDMVEMRTSDTTFLPQAIYYALSILSRLLVDSYALYATEPRQTWLEINQLYLYAESNDFHNTPVNPINVQHEPSPATIAKAYKRIVLLALANPYHLMQGEAVKMYQLLKNWCVQCKIEPLGNTSTLDGKLFVDLAVDAAPMYAPKSHSGLHTIEARLLEITGLLTQIESRTHHIAIENRGSGSQSNLGRRMQRDMYLRWSESWGLRRERMSHRKIRQAPAHMLCGLTATHRYISGGHEFAPEEDEVRLRGSKDSIAAGLSLSLVPEEHQPWLLEEEKATVLSSGKARTSHFDASTNTSDRDLWVRVYTTSDSALDEYNTTNKTDENAPRACEIRNSNQGGYGIHCPPESALSARVGELVATQDGDGSDIWSIGVTRWMKIDDKQGFATGVKIIAEDACPAATKALQGVGKGSEYYRGLIIPDMDPVDHPTTLITPPAVYDIGSVLQLTTNKRLTYIRLTRQLDATSSFSHYQFDIVPPPDGVSPTVRPQSPPKNMFL